MNKITLLLLIAFSILTLLACAPLTPQTALSTPTIIPNASTTVNARLNENFVLRARQTGMITDTPDQFGIMFYAVAQDSRCPQGMACVWAGEVRVQITFQEQGLLHPPVLELTTTPYDERHAIVVENYRVELVDVQPPRIAGKPIAVDEYAATFRVTIAPKTTATPVPPTACLGLTHQDAQGILGVALVPTPAPDILISPQFDDLAQPIPSRGLCGYISTELNLDSAPAIGMPRVISPTLAAYAITAARLTGAQTIELARIANMVRGVTLNADSTPYLILKTRLAAGDWEGIFGTFQELAKNSKDVRMETTDRFGDEGLWIWREARANNYAALLVRDKNSFVVMEALTVKTMQETAVQEAMHAAMAKIFP